MAKQPKQPKKKVFELPEDALEPCWLPQHNGEETISDNIVWKAFDGKWVAQGLLT